MENKHYRADIDGLRSIAVIIVLFFHLDFHYIPGGFVGVDVFFVISGFLITGLIKKEIESTGRLNFKNFYLRRVRRLAPALIFTLIFTIIIAALVFSPTHLSRIGGALSSALLSVSNFYFWLETDYFDVSGKLKPLLHTWSLSVEEQFYFIWPLLLLWLMKLKKSWIPPAFLLALGVVSLYLNLKFGDGTVDTVNARFPKIAEWIEDGQATIFFLLPFRIYEFAIGALVVWLIQYKSKRWIYDLLFILGLMLIGYAALTFTDKLIFPSYYGLVPTLGTALIIYSGKESRFNYILANPVAVSIGLISYSLYLTHWPIIVFWNYYNETINLNSSFIIIFISMMIAIMSYHFIEKPFRKKDYDLALPKWKYGSIFAVTTLACIGINIEQSNGWEWRINSPIVFENSANAKDFHKKFYGGTGYKGFVQTTNTQADIVLIGDSHGRHYAEGLHSEWAKKNNLSLYVSNCYSSMYLPNFIRVNNAQTIKLSSEAFEKDLPFIKNGNTPVVVISQSWLYQMKNADLVDERGNRKNINVTVEDIIKGIYGLKEMIGDSELVVIGNVPGSKHNLYDIFSRPRPLLFSKFDPDQYITVESSDKKVEFNLKLKTAAKLSGKFIFLDPHDVLCTNGQCRNLDSENHLIYSDINHLSKYGSIAVIRGFLPVLEKL